jgi:hypothetical protein
MVFVKNPKLQVKDINFLKSARFTSFTYQAETAAEGVVDGVLPAGSIYPKNDATAIGVTINDVDVSNGAQPVGVIVAGHLLFDRLPLAPADAAIAALKAVVFYDENGLPMAKTAAEPVGE